MLMRDPDVARAALTAIKSLGAKIALDDFGTGYSSLSMLRLLPLHCLEIDQSFVRDIGRDADPETIVCAIISLANSLGLKTLAEGVEKANQALFLRQKGVDIGQGYRYTMKQRLHLAGWHRAMNVSRPIPVDELAQAWQHIGADDRQPAATPAPRQV